MFVKSKKYMWYMLGNSHFTSAMDLITREQNAHVRSIPMVNKKTPTNNKTINK